MSLPSLSGVGGLASAAAANASAAASGLVASAAAAAGAMQPIVFNRIGECSPKEEELRGKKTVHLFDQSRTGDVRALESDLTAFVKQLAAFENTGNADGSSTTSTVKAFYIGLCSGEKLKKALTKRYEHFKPNTGFSHLYAIYSSSNFYHAAEMERRLVFNLSTDSHCINARNAAIAKIEKPDSNENVMYTVFVALRRWGEAMPHQIEGGAVEDDESCVVM